MGRKILNPRICACPGRDRGGEEMSEQKKKDKNATNAETTHQQPEKVSSSSSSCQETPPPTPVEETKSLHQDNNKLFGKRSATKITEGFQLQSLSAYKKIKREEDEIFTIQVRGREKYELLLKIKEGIDLMDMVPQSYLDSYRMGCAPCGPNWFLEQQRKENAEKRGRQENSPDSQEVSNSQNSDCEGTPPSSFPYNLSELSRTSSNTSRSSQGSNTGDSPEYATVRFTLKHTVSLEKKGLKKKEAE